MKMTIEVHVSEHEKNLDILAERIRLRLERSVEDIIAIGHDLSSAKQQIGHGRFEEWIETEFSMSLRTAERFMAIGSRFDKNDIVTTLPVSVLYELASPSTHDLLIEDVRERVAAGETFTATEIRELRTEAQGLRDKTKALVREKGELADRVVDLEYELEQKSPVIQLGPDQAGLDRQYRAFVGHWKSLPRELQQRFWGEHHKPLSTSAMDDPPAFLIRPQNIG